MNTLKITQWGPGLSALKKRAGLFLISVLFFCSNNTSLAQAIGGIINSYAAVTNIAGSNITVGSTTGFSIGDKVMVIQMKGASVNTANNPTFGSITSMGGAGTYEFLRITNIAGLVITVGTAPVNSYNFTSGFTQLVTVAAHCQATVTSVLTCPAWSDVTGVGGVLALESDILTLNSDIDVSNRGFRGGNFAWMPFGCNTGMYTGAYPGVWPNAGSEKGESISQWIVNNNAYKGMQANGGGGANPGNSGGGGGANGGSGGLGGNQVNSCPTPTIDERGIGGANLTQALTTMFLGGGGGAGYKDNTGVCTNGGAGGGIIYIMANQMICNNRTIASNGEDVTIITNDEGAGGGGGGGTIFLECSVFTGNLNVNATGGDGGSNFNSLFPTLCHAPGGGGGGGVLSLALALLPGSITYNSTAGAPGLIYNPASACYLSSSGATSGTGGVFLPNLPHVTVGPLITSGTTTFCINGGGTTPIAATSTLPPGPYTYTWYPGPLVGPIQNVSPTVTTIYTVMTTSGTGGCPQIGTVAVTVPTDCCTQPTTALTPITGPLISGPYANSSFFIDQNVTLSANVSFYNSEILVLPGVNITVPATLVLDLDHVHLYSCGTSLWQGIVVQDGGQVTTSNSLLQSNLIEDAVVAMDVDNITLAHATPPLRINNVIFNKNYIGIKLSNSVPALSTLGMDIRECVFSSKDMPFTSISWPDADVSVTGLRYETPGGSLGLAPPYPLLAYPQMNLKLPYGSQTAYTGIEIDDVGNVGGGFMPSAGVDIGLTYPTAVSEFNLFDGLTRGVHVKNASFTTMNNVFQNCYHGIFHEVTGLFNARLDLTPTTPSTAFGNRFWDCWIAVQTSNVYEAHIEYGIFRSTRTLSTGFGPGVDGVILISNRFNYNIQKCEFNNLAWNLWMGVNSGAYNMGSSSSGGGVYADDIKVLQNYVGAHVNSTNPIPTQYSDQSITLRGIGASNWNNVGKCQIHSNKLNRIFRGIRTEYTDEYPIEIGGNEILLLDDNSVFSTPEQYGIQSEKSLDFLVIDQNLVTGPGNNNGWNPRIKLIKSINNVSNSGGQSPIITCNEVTDGYIGFEFDGSQLSTIWHGNTMFQTMSIGLSLINNGEIGVQGNPGMSCGNRWDDNGYLAPNDWNSNTHTQVDAASSAFPNSFLWCENIPGYTLPTNNISLGGGFPFSFGPPSLGLATPFDYYCFNRPGTYPSTPSQRMAGSTAIKENAGISDHWSVVVFPNPSDGKITVLSSISDELLSIKITDLTGKLVYSDSVKNTANSGIDLSALKASIYFVEVKNRDNKVARTKLVLTK